MDSGPERPSESCEDTLPEFPAVVDEARNKAARSVRHVRRRRAVRQAFQASAEFAKGAPEMALELIMGILP